MEDDLLLTGRLYTGQQLPHQPTLQVVNLQADLFAPRQAENDAGGRIKGIGVILLQAEGQRLLLLNLLQADLEIDR